DVLHAGTLQGLRILGVDDNASTRTCLASLLSAWGAHVDYVSDGPGALAQLHTASREACPYDVVLLDSQLPDTNALTLARTIKANPLLAPVRLVLLTPFGQHAPRVAEHGEVFAGHLAKPVRQSLLYECLVAARERPGVASSVISPGAREEHPPSGAKVLVVEDNVVNQKVLVRMLERYGCKVDVAVNGREAVNTSAQNAYDCLFMDCLMPEMDGYTATAVIRQREVQTGCHVPIIAMTASAQQSDRERCLAV